MERVYGCWKIGFIYLVCGVFSYGITSILLNDTVQCGATPSLMGLFAMLFLDIYENYYYLKHPKTNICLLGAYILGHIILSFLPGSDWISMFCGLLQGFLIGVWMIPYVGVRSRKRYLVVSISIPLMIYTWYLLFGGLFYLAEDYGGCDFCEDSTCYNTHGWCDW